MTGDVDQGSVKVSDLNETIDGRTAFVVPTLDCGVGRWILRTSTATVWAGPLGWRPMQWQHREQLSLRVQFRHPTVTSEEVISTLLLAR